MTSVNRTRQVLWGSLAMLAARVFGMLGGFLVIGILTRQLSSEGFALWSVLGSLAFFASAFDVGLGQGLRNRLASLSAEQGEDSEQEQKKQFFSTFWFLSGISAVLLVIFLVVGSVLPWTSLLNTGNHFSETAVRDSVFVIAVLSLANIVFSIASNALFAYQQAQLKAVMDAVQVVFNIVLVYLATRTGNVFTVIHVYYLVPALLAALTFVVFLVWKKWSMQYIGLKTAVQNIRGILGSSLQFWLMSLFAIVLFNMDPALLSAAGAFDQVDEFSIVQKVFLLLIGVHFAVMTPMWSAYTQAQAQKDWTWIRSSLKKSLVITGGLYVVGGTFFMLIYRWLIHWWTGMSITDSVFVLLMLLWSAVYAFINCFSVLLNGLGIVRVQVIMMTISVGLHLLLCTYGTWLWGMRGFMVGAIVSILPMLVSNFIQVTMLLRNRRFP